MDVGVVMSRAVLADTLEDGCVRQRAVATWNTRRVPTRLTPGWTNRLYVACDGRWCGYFPLSGDVLWNRADVQAPDALIFDPRRWTPIAPQPSPRFRGWRYLEGRPGGAGADSGRPAVVPAAIINFPHRPPGVFPHRP
jgi:hypothetical protein